MFVLKCVPGEHSYGLREYKSGKFLDAYVIVGAVVDFHAGGVSVRYRLDDGKIHEESWGQGTDGTAIFPEAVQLNTVLYGHFMPHKEGTNAPVRKVIMAVNELAPLDCNPNQRTCRLCSRVRRSLQLTCNDSK